MTPQNYRRKHGLPPQFRDLKFPVRARSRKLSPAEYIEEFDKLNGLTPVDYTCFSSKEVGL